MKFGDNEHLRRLAEMEAARKPRLRVLVYTPGQAEPELREIPDALPAMQALVGGYIEAVRVSRALQAICNEEGRLQELPYNRMGLVGTFFVVRTHGAEMVSLTDEDVTFARTLIEAPP